MFQPSPNLKAGCNSVTRSAVCVDIEFQPSPNLKAGCNPMDGIHACAIVRVSTLTQPQGRVQRRIMTKYCHTISGFNPHPTSRPGATCCYGMPSAIMMFQPSPNLKAGCNARAVKAGAALIDAPVCAGRCLYLLKSIENAVIADLRSISSSLFCGCIGLSSGSTSCFNVVRGPRACCVSIGGSRWLKDERRIIVNIMLQTECPEIAFP